MFSPSPLEGEDEGGIGAHPAIGTTILEQVVPYGEFWKPDLGALFSVTMETF